MCTSPPVPLNMLELISKQASSSSPFDSDSEDWGSPISPGTRMRSYTALLVEAIREGYLLHYAAGRVVRPEDPDLSLLAGDRLYALGLARLAELGDLEAVGELADVISLAAQAHAEGIRIARPRSGRRARGSSRTVRRRTTNVPRRRGGASASSASIIFAWQCPLLAAHRLSPSTRTTA